MIEFFDCGWCRGCFEGMKDYDLRVKARRQTQKNPAYKDWIQEVRDEVFESAYNKLAEAHVLRRKHKPVVFEGVEYCSSKCLREYKRSLKVTEWR